jgi:hypothetical protein
MLRDPLSASVGSTKDPAGSPPARVVPGWAAVVAVVSPGAQAAANTAMLDSRMKSLLVRAVPRNLFGINSRLFGITICTSDD